MQLILFYAVFSCVRLTGSPFWVALSFPDLYVQWPLFFDTRNEPQGAHMLEFRVLNSSHGLRGLHTYRILGSRSRYMCKDTQSRGVSFPRMVTRQIHQGAGFPVIGLWMEYILDGMYMKVLMGSYPCEGGQTYVGQYLHIIKTLKICFWAYIYMLVLLFLRFCHPVPSTAWQWGGEEGGGGSRVPQVLYSP